MSTDFNFEKELNDAVAIAVIRDRKLISNTLFNTVFSECSLKLESLSEIGIVCNPDDPKSSEFAQTLQQDLSTIRQDIAYILEAFKEISLCLIDIDQEGIAAQTSELINKLAIKATNSTILQKKWEENKTRSKAASNARYTKTRDLKFQAVNTAMEFWVEPEHSAKKHDAMARFLIEEYSEGEDHPFGKLNYNGLKKAIKDHLKKNDRIDLIFNG